MTQIQNKLGFSVLLKRNIKRFDFILFTNKELKSKRFCCITDNKYTFLHDHNANENNRATISDPKHITRKYKNPAIPFCLQCYFTRMALAGHIS